MSAATAVRELTTARRTGRPCPPLRGRLLPDGDVDAAYAVQRQQVDAWLAAGQRRVGVKVGLTSRVVQDAFGVHHPDFGVLTDVMAVPDGAEVPLDGLLQPLGNPLHALGWLATTMARAGDPLRAGDRRGQRRRVDHRSRRGAHHGATGWTSAPSCWNSAGGGWWAARRT